MINNNERKELFGSKNRSFRLKSNSLKDNNNINFTNKKSAFIPMGVNLTIDDIALFLNLFFGKDGYKQKISNYYFPKQIIFRKNMIPGPLINIPMNVNKYIKSIFSTGIKVKNIPSPKLSTITNTIVDYTQIYKHILIKDPSNVLKIISNGYILKIMPEFITNYIMSKKEEYETLKPTFLHTMGLTIPTAGLVNKNFQSNGFDNVIIPYKITSNDKNFFIKNRLSGIQTIPSNLLKDVVSAYDYSVIKMIVDAYNSGEASDDVVYNSWLNMLRASNPVFIFYNNNNYFTVDMSECKNKLKIDVNKFVTLISKFITLIVMDNNDEVDKDTLNTLHKSIDDMYNDDDESDIIEPTDTEPVSKSDTEIDAKLNNIYSNMIKRNAKHDNVNIGDTINELLKDDGSVDIDINSITDSESNLYKNITLDKKEAALKKVMKRIEFGMGKNTFNEIDDNSEDPPDAIIEIHDPSDDVKIDEDIPDTSGESSDDSNVEVTDEEKKIMLTTMKNEQIGKKYSPKQIQRINSIKNKYKSVKVLDDMTVEDLINRLDTTAIETNIKSVDIRDKSFEQNNVRDVETSYVNKTMKKDLVNMIHSFANSDKDNPFHIVGYKEEDTSDIFTNSTTYTIRLEDHNGKQHNLKMTLPKIDENGRLKINGNYKILKKQLLLLPVSKIKPDLIMVTSMFNKTMISRNGVTINWLTSALNDVLINKFKESESCLVKIGNASIRNDYYVTHIEYDFFSYKYTTIELNYNKGSKRKVIIFNQDSLRDKIRTMFPTYQFKDNVLPYGIDYGNNTVLDFKTDAPNASFSKQLLIDLVNSEVVPNLQEELKSFSSTTKNTFSDILLQNKKIPLILFLGGIYTLSKVLDTYKGDYQITDTLIKGDSRAYIKFKDVYLYYNEYPIENALLFNGLKMIDTKEFTLAEMDTSVPYLLYLKHKHKNTNIFKGWVSFRELFIDPITKEVLEDMELPTDLLELLLCCNDMLNDNSFISETDVSTYRIRGYEVFIEMLYKSMCTQYIAIRQKRNPSKMSFTIPPTDVFTKLNGYPLLDNLNVTNPVNELKEKAIISFKGSSGTMVEQAFSLSKRGYTQANLGIIGMSSVDNSNVGVTKELSMNARITSTRGYIKSFDSKKDNIKSLSAANVVCIQEAIYPFNIKVDDAKRVGLTSNQTIHSVQIEKSDPPIVSTGVEESIIYHSSNSFSGLSKGDGVIAEVDDVSKMIKIQYKDGSKEVVSYGEKMHRNSNYFVKAELTCNVKPGQKIKKNDVLVYDKSFFEKDGDRFIYKKGVVANIAVYDSDYTDDDSMMVTEAFSERIQTPIITRKQIVFSPETNIIRFTDLGDKILSGDPLMVFEDMAGDLDTAKMLGKMSELDDLYKEDFVYHSPAANSSGYISDISVYWTCDIEEFSESCQKFIRKYIKRVNEKMKKEKEFMGDKFDKTKYNVTKVTPIRNRVNGVELPEDGRGIVIEYFIQKKHGLSDGDKISIIGLKGIIAEVVPKGSEPYRVLADGSIEKIEVITSFTGAMKRMINSIFFSGALAKLMNDYSTDLARKYLDEIGDKK